MSQIVDTWQNLDARRRVILLGAIGLTFLAVLSLAQIATRPGMSLLYAGLDPNAAGEVVTALDQMNVEAEIRGDAIYVPEDARDRVRLALAGEGLPRQGQAGYGILDEISGFSATSDMFNAAYWRAKEGELARTILSSPGVRAARVHIAVPSRRPFSRAGAGATASVTVTMASGNLTTSQATGIRYLVALAVPDLSPDQVAVIDSRSGMVLAPGSDTGIGNADNMAGEKEAKLKAEIEELLAARVGRDRARVSVAVETDRAAQTITERQILPDSRVIIHSNTEEISDSAEGASGSVTVASNLPDGDAGANNSRQSARTESREQQNYEYSETTRQTVRQAGAIERISVAVLVDGIIVPDANGEGQWQPRPQEELDTLRELVIAAVGYDEERGDIVTVESMAFQPDATPGELIEVSPVMRFIERNAMTLIQLGFLGIVAMVLGMAVIKPLLTRRADSKADPALALGGPGAAGLGMDAAMAENGNLSVLQSQGGAASGQGGEDGDETALTAPMPPSEALKAMIAERPEHAIKMLTDWLEEEEADQDLVQEVA